MPSHPSFIEALSGLPLDALREAIGAADAYLVGGTVRELVMDRPVSGDLDVAIDAELDPILERLGLPARRHERFGTATVQLGGRGVDLARTRAERYPEPGALPRSSRRESRPTYPAATSPSTRWRCR